MCPRHGPKIHVGHLLVSLVCSNKLPCIWWLISNRTLFLTILEAESPSSGWQHGWVLVRALCQFADGWLLIFSHGRKKGEGALWNTFKRALVPFRRARISTYEFGVGHK